MRRGHRRIRHQAPICHTLRSRRSCGIQAVQRDLQAVLARVSGSCFLHCRRRGNWRCRRGRLVTGHGPIHTRDKEGNFQESGGEVFIPHFCCTDPTKRIRRINTSGLWLVPMPCKSCASLNQGTFTGEIAILFPGLKPIDKPILWVFPKLIVCLDCGTTEFTVPKSELRRLAKRRRRCERLNLQLELTS